MSEHIPLPDMDRRNFLRFATLTSMYAGATAASRVTGASQWFNRTVADSFEGVGRLVQAELNPSPASVTISVDPVEGRLFLPAGDSLSYGYMGGTDSFGYLKGWVEPMVDILKARRLLALPAGFDLRTQAWLFLPDKDNGFAAPGLDSKGMLAMLRDPNLRAALGGFADVTWCMSLGFNELGNMDLRRPVLVPAIINRTLNEYEQNLRAIVYELKQIRRQSLDSLTVIMLGLPDLSQLPAVRRVVSGTPLEGHVGSLASATNQIMAEVCNEENRRGEMNGAGYVDIFNPSRASPIAPGDISPDGLHPTQAGYDPMGRAAADIFVMKQYNNKT